MAKIAILGGDIEGYDVWISLDDDDPPDGLNFVIGVGRTRREAIESAEQELKSCLDNLTSMREKI